MTLFVWLKWHVIKSFCLWSQINSLNTDSQSSGLHAALIIAEKRTASWEQRSLETKKSDCQRSRVWWNLIQKRRISVECHERWWLNIAKASWFWIGWPRCSCRVFRVRFSPVTWNQDDGARVEGCGPESMWKVGEGEKVSNAEVWPTFWNCVVSLNQLASKAKYSSSSGKNEIRMGWNNHNQIVVKKEGYYCCFAQVSQNICFVGNEAFIEINQ